MAGTPYNGLSANVAAPAAVNIQSSTNASPIVVQTAAAHGCLTGDIIDVSGHQVNTAANGQWRVIVNDSTHVQLVGSTGSGVGGATGTTQAIVFTGNISLNPVNGDPYDASTYIPGMSCLADRTAKLAVMTGGWKIVNIFSTFGGTPFNSWATIASFTALTPLDWSSGGIMPFVNAVAPNSLAVEANDLVLVDVVTSFDVTSNSGDSSSTRYSNLLYTANWVPGGSPSFSTANASQDSSVLVPASGGYQDIRSIHLRALVECPFSGFFDFKLRLEANATLTKTLSLDGSYQANAIVLRATAWPQ